MTEKINTNNKISKNSHSQLKRGISKEGTRENGGGSLEELVLLLGEDLGRGFGVEEKLVDLFDLLFADLVFRVDSRQQVRWREQLHSVPVNKTSHDLHIKETRCQNIVAHNTVTMF